MPSFFRRRKLIVLLTGLIIIVALIGYSMRQNPIQTSSVNLYWIQSVFFKISFTHRLIW